MTFKDYPPRQKAASFNMDEVFAKLKESGGAKWDRGGGTLPESAPPFDSHLEV